MLDVGKSSYLFTLHHWKLSHCLGMCLSRQLLFYQWAYSTCLSVDIISHHHVCEPLLNVVYQFMQSHYLYICVCLLLQPTPSVSLMYIMHDGYTVLTLATNATDVGMPINIL